MIDTKDIYWLAGLLEGEGCFAVNNSKYHTPQITLKMTDLDVVEKAYKLMGITSSLLEEKRSEIGRKRIWWFRAMGSLAVGWMMTLYPLMGERRKAKIKEVLTIWKAGTYKKRELGVPAWLLGHVRNPEYSLKYHKAIKAVSTNV